MRKLREIITNILLADVRAGVLSLRELRQIADSIFYTVRCELGVLTPLMEDNEITEIMVNGTGSIYVERGGHMENSSLTFDSAEELEEVIRRIAAGVHREINEMIPILDARLENGDRVNAVYKNVGARRAIAFDKKVSENGAYYGKTDRIRQHYAGSGRISQKSGGSGL